jgi:hypothetical protein
MNSALLIYSMENLTILNGRDVVFGQPIQRIILAEQLALAAKTAHIDNRFLLRNLIYRGQKRCAVMYCTVNMMCR